MPRYHVYETDTGRIVHTHESYDITGGESLPCTREEVLALVDETLRGTNLEVVETGSEKLSAGHIPRVDTKTGEVVQEAREPSAK